MQESSWDWVYELVNTKPKIEPELPEDVLMLLCNKNAVFEEFIEAFDLELEM